EKERRGYAFPYLFDADQSVAKAYTAACTPDFFLFDAEHELAYRGQLDDTRPYRISSGNYDDRNGAANGKDLRAAIDAVIAGQPVAEKQYPSIGCNIKWKPGNEPGYFG
ncbi:MAG: thioredoxin family protein, partial [Planctomycetota bacterium]